MLPTAAKLLLTTGATHYNEQLGLPDKGCAIKVMVVYTSCYLELRVWPWLYQPPPPEVLIIKT